MNKVSFLNRSFWATLLGLSVTMMVIALFFQHYLNHEPCVLCVHIRAWVISLGIVSTIALLINHNVMRLTAFVAASGLLAMFAIDTYELWQIETGVKMGSCSWSAGFPELLPLNEWAPWLFEIGGICGQSPDMLLGFTMAETLMHVAGVLLAFFGLSLVVTFRRSYLNKVNA